MLPKPRKDHGHIFPGDVERQLALRLLSSASHIDGKKLQTGRLTTDEWTKLGQAASMLSSFDLLINDNPSDSGRYERPMPQAQ